MTFPVRPGYSGMNDIARLLMAQQMGQPSMNNAMAVQQPVPQQAIPRGASRSQQLLAQQLMQAGTDTSPVGHWTQALARVVQGGVGGHMQRKQETAEGERQSAIGEALKGAAGGDREAAMRLLSVDPQLGIGALNLAKPPEDKYQDVSGVGLVKIGAAGPEVAIPVPPKQEPKRDIRVIEGQAVDFTDPDNPKPIYSAPEKAKPGFAILSPEQAKQLGLDERGKYQIGPNGQIQAITQPPADQKAPEAIRTSQIKMGAAQRVFNDYEEAVKRIGPKFVPGSDKSELTTHYATMVLELKNLGELGVLAGPDMSIINNLLVDPTSVTAQRLGPEGLARNIKAAKQYMNRKLEAYQQTSGAKPESDPLGLFN